ncbi:ABC transporter [Lachnellula hyalina]|uniref:ABC transporter n=1 Tax=Lachnellula hyalina TaxID=1316788 RepID=A0A8H8R2Q0_9HELO|nr:ABC transporter [Lachnellula hyalina]TVY27403.1 ABC transporter [Lachnellula hyalina]
MYESAWLLYGIQNQLENRYANAAQLALAAVRLIVLLCLIVLWLVTSHEEKSHSSTQSGENESLLDHGPGTDYSYGTSKARDGNNAYNARVGDAQTTTWLDYVLGFSKLFPFLWPAESKPLQLRAIFCFVLLIAQRVVNILTPHQLGVLVTTLGPGKLPHKQIFLYILFRGFQGQQGILGSIRALLWIPISQSTYRRLSTATFKHVLELSLDFHISKRIGEVTNALSKGGALNTFLDGFAFQLFPMVADLWIAAAYFFIVFDPFYALMVIAVTWFYIFMTIYMAKYRGRARREMVKREREMEAAKSGPMLSYLTKPCIIAVLLLSEYNVFLSLNLLNAAQNGVFTLGTLLVCYLNAYQISMNMQQVAMFVTLLTYLAQLQAPLNFFGSFYTQVQNNLVDAERMLELFEQKPTVVDSEDAVDVSKCNGGISFSNVSFAYNGQHPALQNVSFEVLPGTSTAIVGESGSGKSTILKLLFRFYDISDGSIKLDGLDTREMRIESLRSHMGVVPQDTILFNDTLMYNLLYSQPNASEEDVYKACMAASIHHQILSFSDQYSTTVGERGLKLSGGERQRIAIARAFLRSPRILLLDEATASLDSETEKQIQGSLEKVSEGRTTITIAHRLSTITKANQIIVLQKGRIMEKGTHVGLLARNGLYARMWRKQTEGAIRPWSPP